MDYEVVQQHERSHHTGIPYKLYNTSNQMPRNGRQPGGTMSRSRRELDHDIELDVDPRDPRMYYESTSLPMTFVTTSTNIDVSPLAAGQRTTKNSLLFHEYDDDEDDSYRQISRHPEQETKKCLDAFQVAPLSDARAFEYALRTEHYDNKWAQHYDSQTNREQGRAEMRYADCHLDNKIEFLPSFDNTQGPSPQRRRVQPEPYESRPVCRPHGRQRALRRHVSDSNIARHTNVARGFPSRNVGTQPCERDRIIQYSRFQKDTERLPGGRPTHDEKDREKTLNRSQSLSIGLGRSSNSAEPVDKYTAAAAAAALRHQYSLDECPVVTASFADGVDPYEVAPNEPRTRHREFPDNQFANRESSPSVQGKCAPRNPRRQQSENDIPGSQLLAGMTRYPTKPRRENDSDTQPSFTTPKCQKQHFLGSKRSPRDMLLDEQKQMPSRSSCSDARNSVELSISNVDASGQTCAAPLRRKSSLARTGACPDHVARLVRHHSDSFVHLRKARHESPSVRQVRRYHSTEDLASSRIQRARGLGRQLSMMSISEDEEPTWTQDDEHSADRWDCQPADSRKQQRSIHVDDSMTKTVEVAPGNFTVLRGAKETWDAIQDGFVLIRQCKECYEECCFIMDADYFLCPCCKCIGLVSSNSDNGFEGGVGLGLSTQLMKTIAAQRRTCKRPTKAGAR